MRYACIRGIAVHVPSRTLTNDELAPSFPGWDAERFGEKTGIRSRHVVENGECASDLAFAAAQTLFEESGSRPATFDFVIFCSETPDYVTPSTSALLQQRLGIPSASGAIDLNQACAGYIHSLAVARGLLETGAATNVLLTTGTTYSRMLDPEDRGVRPLFGDAGTATWLSTAEMDEPALGPFVFGSDGGGAEHIMVRGGGFRHPGEPVVLRMNGPEIAAFTLRVVPATVHQLLAAGDETLESISAFVFHQPNRMLLDQLRRKIGIPSEKMFIDLETTGNTGSSSIPLALHNALERGSLGAGHRVMLVGFGGGLAWAGTMLRLL